MFLFIRKEFALPYISNKGTNQEKGSANGKLRIVAPCIMMEKIP